MKTFILIFITLKYTFAIEKSQLKVEKFYSTEENQHLNDLIERLVEEVEDRIKCILYIADSYYQQTMEQMKVSRFFPVFKLKIRDNDEFSPSRNQVISILNNSRDAACNLYIILNINGTQNLKLIQFLEEIAVFQHTPAVTKIAEKYYKNIFNKTSQALGVEIELMKLIIKGIKCKPVFYAPRNIQKTRWGNVEENKTTGLLGEAANGKAAFYLGNLHYTSRHLNIMDLAWPYNIECLTFLTADSLTENSWKLLILPFKLSSWISVILILLMAVIIIFLMTLVYENKIILYNIDDSSDIEKTRKKLKSIKYQNNPLEENYSNEMRGLYLFSNLQNSILYTYSMLLQVSLPDLPKATAVRIFIGCWWIYSMLITVTYRASMTAALANPIVRRTIDTLEELAKSSVLIGSWGNDKREFFLKSEDDNCQILGLRFEEIEDEKDAIDRVAAGKFSYYENIFVLQELRVKRQLIDDELKKNGNNYQNNYLLDQNLHIMQECIINIPTSLGMDKNSPLKPRVDQLIKNAVELGLVQKWLKSVMEWSKIAETKEDNYSEKALVNFHKLQGALVALMIGYFLSFLALTAEIFHWKYIVTQDPSFNKYHLDSFYSDNRKIKLR